MVDFIRPVQRGDNRGKCIVSRAPWVLGLPSKLGGLGIGLNAFLLEDNKGPLSELVLCYFQFYSLLENYIYPSIVGIFLIKKYGTVV